MPRKKTGAASPAVTGSGIAVGTASTCGKCGAAEPTKGRGGDVVSWIGCCACDTWYHCCCVGVSSSDFQEHYYNTNIKWTCTSCINLLKRTLKRRNKTVSDTEITASAVDTIGAGLEEVKDSLAALGSALHGLEEIKGIGEKVDSVHEKLASIDIRDREAVRERSLIISNFPRTLFNRIPDLSLRLTTSLGLHSSFVNRIDTVFPFKSAESGGPSRLCVRFHSPSDRRTFFRAYISILGSSPLTLDKWLEGCPSTRIYLAEDLDRSEFTLYKRALRLKRRGQIRSVATINRRVFVVPAITLDSAASSSAPRTSAPLRVRATPDFLSELELRGVVERDDQAGDDRLDVGTAKHVPA